MDKNILVIGGDLRICKLASMFADDGNNVRVYGMEKSEEINKNSKIIKCENLDDAISESEIIISAIPFLKQEKIYATYSDKYIDVEELTKMNNNNKIFIAGSIKEKELELLSKSFGKVIDIMKKEELAILNTIATAEGTIEIAINNTEKILQGSRVLVLGFGRVGKMVAKKFDNLSCFVTCTARKPEDLSWITSFGFKEMNINNLKKNLNKYDIIINTVPQIIITKEEMNFMNKDVLLIDLASSPGGIDRNGAKELNLKLIWALGLPGKVAPVSSAEFIKKVIYEIFSKDK